jgi:hypothetical protein
MNGFASACLILLLLAETPVATDNNTIKSIYADQDPALTLDPSSPFWREAASTKLERDKFGKSVPGFSAEVRTRWTKNNIYFLFSSPYEQLYLKPNPSTQQETNELWKWDVAEVFIGSDFDDIQRYKEFEVSPQGEWVDLDINLHIPHHEDGWKWNSGFGAAAHIGQAKHVWYAAMRIPLSAIDKRAAVAGNTLRINLFLSQGPPERHREIAWQAPMNETFHVPEKFGLIRLENK